MAACAPAGGSVPGPLCVPYFAGDHARPRHLGAAPWFDGPSVPSLRAVNKAAECSCALVHSALAAGRDRTVLRARQHPQVVLYGRRHVPADRRAPTQHRGELRSHFQMERNSRLCCPARLVCAWFYREKSTGFHAVILGCCDPAQLVADTALQTRITVWTDNRSLDRGLAPAAHAASERAAADPVLSSADSRPSSAARAADDETGPRHAAHAAALPPPLKERAADERGKQTEQGGGDADKDVSAKERSGSGSRGSCARSPRRGKLSERESRAGAGGRLMRVFSNAAYAWREAALLGAPPLRAARTPTAAPVHAAARVTPYPNPVFLDPALRWRSATSARRDASGRTRVPRPHSSGLGGHSARWARSPRAPAAAGDPAPQKPPCAAIELCAQPALLATAADASALGAAARMT